MLVASGLHRRRRSRSTLGTGASLAPLRERGKTSIRQRNGPLAYWCSVARQPRTGVGLYLTQVTAPNGSALREVPEVLATLAATRSGGGALASWYTYSAE